MSYLCAKCGKSLGKGRARQGLSLHPSCRTVPARAELDQLIEQARSMLDKVERAGAQGDEEFQKMFAAAAAQAKTVIHDLKTLRGSLGSRKH